MGKENCSICRNLIIFAGNVIIKLDLINSKIKTFSIVPGIIARLFILPVLLLVSPFLLISVFLGINCFQKVPSSGKKLEKGPLKQQKRLVKNQTQKIMSFNIRCGINRKSIFNIEKTAASIRDAGVSVIGIQEVTDNGQNGRWVGTTCISGEENHKKENQAKRLSELTGLKYFEYFGVHNLVRGGTFGVSILSSHKILETKTYKYKRWRGRDQRGALAVRIDLNEMSNETPFKKMEGWFVVTHLQNDVTGLEQQDEAMELLSFLATLKGTEFVVIMGDFNSTPKFSAPKIISRIYGPCLAQRECVRADKMQGTFPNGCGAIKIDYIWFKSCVADNIYPINFNVLNDDEASDHFPIVGTLTF